MMKMRSNGCTTLLVLPVEITFQYSEGDRSTLITLWAKCREEKLSVLVCGTLGMIFEDSGLRRMIKGDLCVGYVPKRVIPLDSKEFDLHPSSVLFGDFYLKE